MGHRHFTNAFDFGINQGHNDNHSSAEQSIVHMGPIPSENPTFIYPMDNNMLRSGANPDIRWNSEGRANEYSSSNFSMEVQNFPPPFPAQSYDPYPRSSLATNLYPAPQVNNTGHVHSSYYNNRPPVIHDAEGSFPGPTTAISGAHKRRRPTFSEAWERGSSTSRFSGAGSSSGSSQFLFENSTSNYQSVPEGPIGVAQYGGSSSQVPAEDLMRNVRSRSRLYMEPHLPSYPSHHYHRNPSGMVPLCNLYTDVTPRDWNPVPLSSTPRARLPTSDVNGSSYDANRIYGGVSAGEVGSCHHEFVSSGHPVSSSSQYLHGPHAQATREGGNYHSQRAIPSYRTSLSYSQLGHEAAAAASMDNGLHSHTESFSYRYSRAAASGGGLRNGYRSGRSRIAAVDRLQSISTVMDSGSEFMMVGGHSLIYDGSRASFDQYRDMRLDIDSMSYEELLALGERIGDVSTGVSEDMMPNCLVQKLYCSADQNHNEENCAICLEEYKAGEGIGELKNCGHGYHVGCIRKWLLKKNVCPICKAAALKECSSSNN